MENYPNNIPASYYSSSPPPIQKKERGVFLNVILGIATVWNLIATFAMVFGGAAIDRRVQNTIDLSAGVQHTVGRLVAVLVIFQVAQMISVMGMWAWKRWALLGYFATSVLAIIGVIKLTGETPVWSMMWLGVMLLAVFPKLGMFED